MFKREGKNMRAMGLPLICRIKEVRYCMKASQEVKQKTFFRIHIKRRNTKKLLNPREAQ